MKRTIMLVAACAVALAFSACSLFTSTASQQTAAQKLAALQTAISNGCTKFQPALTSMVAVEPDVSATAAKYLDKIANTSTGFCAANAALNTDDLQDFVDTGATQIVKAVNAASSINATDKALINAAVVGLQGVISNVLVVPVSTPASSVPATTPASGSVVATS